MPENTPLLDYNSLLGSTGGSPLIADPDIANIPFTAPNLPLPLGLPLIDGSPTPSALSAWENSILSRPASDQDLTGGGITRRLSDVMSDRYNVFVPDYNNEDAYAQGQGWPTKMINGVGKGLLLTATTLLQTTAGTLNGIGRMIDTGNMASFYDNELNREIDELTKQAEDWLPNYYTDVEKNANWYSPSYFFTGNFIWDGIAKNLGFAAGAALSGLAFSSALRALPLTSRLFSVGKGAEALAATEQGLLAANKAADSYGKIKSLSDKFISSYNALNPAGRGLVAALSTTGEAGFEAYHNLNEFRDKEIQEWKDSHFGEEPKGQDLADINARADEVGNSSFALNTAILSVTNFIQFPKILGSSYSVEKGMINALKRDVSEIAQDASGKFIQTGVIKNKLLSSLNSIRPYLFSGAEAFEEGAQYAVAVGTKDYYDKKHDGDLDDVFSSLVTGISETVGTDEGMKNVLIGGLSGALMTGPGRFKENAQKARNTADAIEKFNGRKLSNFTKDTVDSVNRGTTLQKEREESLRRGDILESKDKETDYIVNYLTPRIKYGRLDLVQADINEYKQLASTAQGFAQLQSEGKALDGDTPQAYLQRLDNLENTANNINSIYQSLNLRYGNLVDSKKQPVYSQAVMDQMIYAAVKVADYDKRITELSTNLIGSGIATDTLAREVIAGESTYFNEAVATINGMDVNSDIKESLLRDLTDIAELNLRRQLFLKEYDDIKNSPFKYQEKIAPDTIAPKAISIKKEGEDDFQLEVGEEYYAGEMFNTVEAGEKKRYTKFTVLDAGENDDVIIRTPDGKIHSISKKGLSKYNLAKTSSVTSKNAIAFIRGAHREFIYNRGKGKHIAGTISYDGKTDRLFFKSHDGKVIKPITREDLIPQKGYDVAKVYTHETLTPEEVANAQENVSLEEKLALRNEIIVGIYQDAKNQLERVEKEIKEQKEILAKATKEIEEAPYTKKGTLRTVRSLNNIIKKASAIEEKAAFNLFELEAQKYELTRTIPYLQDLAENSRELPTSGVEMLEEMKSNITHLKELLDSTDREIKLTNSLIESANYVLKAAFNTLKSTIEKFKQANPNVPITIDALRDQVERFLGEEGAKQYIDQKLGYTQLVLDFQESLSELEETLKIPSLEKEITDLQDKIKDLQQDIENLYNEQLAKEVVLSKFEEIAEKYRKAEEEKKKITNNKKLKQELLGTAYKGIPTTPSDKPYDPTSKKTDIQVVTSTIAATESTSAHHVRANLFGAKFDKLPNKEDIRGAEVTSKTEDQLGLSGLTQYLKDQSDQPNKNDINPSKTVVMVMVDESTGKPVGLDGKVLDNPTVETAIFQVKPLPKLTWDKRFSNTGQEISMFREENDHTEFLKDEYKKEYNKTLASTAPIIHEIQVSLGVFDYVTYLDDKDKKQRNHKAVVSVEQAGLIESSDLQNGQVIKVSTTDGNINSGDNSKTYKAPLGRVFLDIGKEAVALKNRQFTPKEAETIYDVIHKASIEIFNIEDVNDTAKNLFNWLKTVIYWGKPQNERGYNSIFVDDNLYYLEMGRDLPQIPFTPSAIQENRDKIVDYLQNMYNNVNNTWLTKDELWNAPYQEIVEVDEKGDIKYRTWVNYQTYLVSDKFVLIDDNHPDQGKSREKQTLPLFTDIRPLEGKDDTNRKGIYFTITDTGDNWIPETPKNVKGDTPAPTPDQKLYTLDGETPNPYITPSGNKIMFAADPTATQDDITKGTDSKIKILKGGDLDKVMAAIKAQEKDPGTEIRKYLWNAILPQLTEVTQKPQEKAEVPKAEQEPSKQKVQRLSNDQSAFDFLMKGALNRDDLRLRLLSENEIFERENWSEIEVWLRANFPNLPVYRVKNVIKGTNGLQAWGMLKNGAIYVTENAEVGTIYHEVFEGVWKLFTSPKEQSSVIYEFKTREGSFVDRPSGKTIKYSDATPQEIKEQLAEEFRDYIINNKAPQKVKRNFIAKLFSDIWNFIKSFFTSKDANKNTNKLFAKIGTGYYKKYTSTYQLAFAKKGIIDIDEAYANHDSELRVKDIPSDIVGDIIQEMTWKTFKILTKEGEDLFSLVPKKRSELYTELKQDLLNVLSNYSQLAVSAMEAGTMSKEVANDEVDKANTLWEAIDSEWEEIKKRYEEHIIQYSLEFDENDEIQKKDEDKIKESDYVSAEKVDGYRKASGAIRLLFSTLPVLVSESEQAYSSIHGVRLIPSAQAYISIENRVHSARNIDEMMDMLKEMGTEDPSYMSIYHRLTSSGPISDIKKKHQAMLLSAFWKTFKKQNADVKVVYILDNGEIEVGDSNLSTAARQTSSEYINNIVRKLKKNSPYYDYSQSNKVYYHKKTGNGKSVISTVSVAKPEDQIKFLKDLGINFTMQDYKKMGSKQKQFTESVKGIKQSLEKASSVKTINTKTLDISNRLLTLGLIRASLDNPEFSSTFFNVNGERVQTYIGVNAVSNLYDYLSKIENIEELENTPYAYLRTDTFSINSFVLKRMFDDKGNRRSGTEDLMKAGWADGTLDIEKGKNTQSSRQTYKQRLLQELTLNKKGYYYTLVPGDASMEHMTYMGIHIPHEVVMASNDALIRVFKGYFIDEINLVRENRPVAKGRKSNEFRFFNDILSNDLKSELLSSEETAEDIYRINKKSIDNAVIKFIEDQTKENLALLEEYGIKRDESTIKTFTTNYIISNIEYHKLLFSDPFQYSDEQKRIKSALSPRQPLLANSPGMNKVLDTIWNEGYDNNDIGHTDFTRDFFQTNTLSDVSAYSDLKDYGVYVETDGAGIISMKANRWLRIKAGNWNASEEKQYRYDVAYKKKHTGETLTAQELIIWKEGNPQVRSAYTPLKPIVFGNQANNQDYNSIILDKFSLYPLSYRIIHQINPNSNALKLHEKMENESVDYVVFDSGRKVGNTVHHSVYNPGGEFNTTKFPKPTNIPHNIISIQTEVPSKEDWRVTRGSQITKLSTLDFMEAGVPIDFKPEEKNFNNRYTEWFNLKDEAAREKQSPLYKEIKNNQELLELSIDNGVNSLLKKMGIELVKGDFKIIDKKKVADTLKEEILKREVNDNIIDALKGFEKGDVILEATPLYFQIRNILYSIADKNVISPKISGGERVQIPSTFLESNRAKHEKENVYSSENLKFYNKDKDGKVQVAEIMVGRWWFDNAATRKLTDDELLNILNKKENEHILQGIAYRVPTQKQNSIEVFKIAKFLPMEFGDSVVVPSQLVKKVGSDFDIDKLNIFLKNITINSKGHIETAEYKGSEKATKDFYRNIYEEDIRKHISKIERFAFFRSKVVEVFQVLESVDDSTRLTTEGISFLLGEKDFDFYIKHEMKLDEIAQQAEETDLLPSEYIQEQINNLQEADEKLMAKLLDDKIKEEYINRMYKNSLENAYIESLYNLISNPLNFDQLIKPNDAEPLKNLANKITKQRGINSFDYKAVGNMMNWHFMSRLRQAFVSGKQAIGIAAVNQTNHSLNQRQPFYIDPARFNKIEPKDLYWLSGGTNKKSDIAIKFKDFNTIKINGKNLPSLSGIKNKAGKYISDIIGMFIDGYVDISKGPWIMELGATPTVAPTWLFLTKLGVPIEDVAYFMNQPIIRDYIKNIENAGFKWLYIDDIFDETLEKYESSQAEISKVTEIPAKGDLYKLIAKKKFTSQENAQQQFILREFLKYAKMAEQLFHVTQGSNFDTANFSDPYLISRKVQQLEKARNTIFSDVDKLLENSFVGKTKLALYNLRDAYAEILTSDTVNVRDVIEKVLSPYWDESERDLLNIARKAVNNLFDWAVQTKGGYNKLIQNILLSKDNVAEEVQDFVNTVRTNTEHTLHYNQVIKLIALHSSDKEQTPNNLKIKNKDNKIYDQNQIISAFREIKEYFNGQNSNIYKRLVALSVLQSGLSNSPISFTSLLPYEDFMEVYNTTISKLETLDNLEDFNDLNVFQRVNWNNSDIVPYRKAQWKETEFGKVYNRNMEFKYLPSLKKAIDNKIIPPLLKLDSRSGQADYDVIVYSWEEGTTKDKQRMRKEGDFSYIKKSLFKKVYRGNTPLYNTYSFKNKENGQDVKIIEYIYKPINAWGDSHTSAGMYFSAQEFYTDGRKSLIDNGFNKVDEVIDQKIVDIFDGKTPKKENPVVNDDSTSNIPSCI